MRRTILVLIGLLFSASSVFAITTSDITCIKNAANERTKKLHTAYDQFSKDMGVAADRLRDDESNRLEYGDQSFRQSELARIQSNYTAELSERTRDLSAKLTDAWNTYRQAANTCNASAQPGSSQPAYVPPNYGAPSYGYGNAYYGNSYGSYYGSQYGYPYGSNWNSSYHGAANCPAPRPLAQPAPGCGYQYGTDSNGCPSYTPVCNNAFSSTSPCTCPASYSPVCSRDGQTYFNACYAVCMGASVQYQGTCGGYRN